MADALAQQAEDDARPFEVRLSELIDAMHDARAQARAHRRTQAAGVPQAADVHDVDCSNRRNVKPDQFNALATCAWIREKHHLIVVAEPARGRSFIACALANEALKKGLTVRYFDTGALLRLWHELEARESLDGLRRQIDEARLLVLDDWGQFTLSAGDVQIVHRILMRRYQSASVLIATAKPIEEWAEWLGAAGPEVAHQIVSRYGLGSVVLELKGESRRVRREIPLDD